MGGLWVEEGVGVVESGVVEVLKQKGGSARKKDG